MSFHVAILGVGNIAAKMAETIQNMKGVTVYAVASRDIEKAKKFAEVYGAEKAYGGYEDMLKDDGIDLVYIATPHSFHFEHMMLCLCHGKNVICEKPFTVSYKEAEEVLKFAEEQRLFVTEAMWIRYMPLAKTLKEIIDSGVIGKISMVTANLGYRINHIERMYKPELAGGAMYDLGCYPLHFISMCLGNKVESVECNIEWYETGVDAQNVVTLHYPENVMGVSSSTMLSTTDRQGILSGEKGYIIVENINNFERIRVFDENYEEKMVYEKPEQITGFEYQIEESKKAVESGQIQCQQLPHEEILRIVGIMEECLMSRRQTV